jgi:hypothetical protein
MESTITSEGLKLNLFLGEARGGLQKSGTSSTATSLDYSSPFKDQDFTSAKKPDMDLGQVSTAAYCTSTTPFRNLKMKRRSFLMHHAVITSASFTD